MQQALLHPIHFTSRDQYELELSAIFEHSWVHVADTTDLPKSGAYVPATIGGSPVLVMRGTDDEIRVFLNACTHRATMLAVEPGVCEKILRCPYHAWSFASDGTLLGVPHRHDFDGYLKDRNLVRVRSAVLGPLIFACLDPAAPPFEVWAGELTGALTTAFPQWEPAYEFDYDVKTNWKTFVQNGLESYHIQFVHDLLRDAMDANAEKHFFEDHASYSYLPPTAMLEQPSGIQMRFGHIFPNLIPVITPVDFTYLRIDPIGPEEIRLRARGFDAGLNSVPMPRDFRGNAYDTTIRQDIPIVERVQRGLRARGLPAAVHAASREARVTHFERMVQTALAAYTVLRKGG